MTTRRLIALAAAVGALAFSSMACATAGGGPRPTAFPGAPVPLPTPVVNRAAPHAAAGASVVQTALALVGVAYRFGGEQPATGLDCSGLVRYVFDRHQVVVPRTTAEQFDLGQPVDRAAVDAGDLIFFTTIGPGPTHVGIALGPDRPGEFVHAPGTGSVVRVERYDSSYWNQRIIGIRRVLG